MWIISKKNGFFYYSTVNYLKSTFVHSIFLECDYLRFYGVFLLNKNIICYKLLLLFEYFTSTERICLLLNCIDSFQISAILYSYR